MKSSVATLFAVLGVLVLAAFAEAQSGDVVYVRGYTRKDGTYVAPHTRQVKSRSSASTFGTPRTPRVRSSSPRSSSSYRLRFGGNGGRSSGYMSTYGRTSGFGGGRSDSVLFDYERNQKKAKRLWSLGYEAQPYQSWSEMADIERRIRKANGLKKLGMTVNWESYSYAELKAMERQMRGK
ncbi:MAG: hypothetical protein ACO1SV_00575 [Fimbriimonas sp.]